MQVTRQEVPVSPEAARWDGTSMAGTGAGGNPPLGPGLCGGGAGRLRQLLISIRQVCLSPW